MVGDEGADCSSESGEELVAGSLELGSEFVGDLEFADEAEVVAVSLVGEVDFSAVFERL